MKKTDLYPLLFVISSAIATVSIDDLVTGIPAMLVLFVVTTIAMIYFHVVNAKQISAIYYRAMQKPFLLLMVNLFLAATWMATYVGIDYLGASVYNIFYFSISAALAASIKHERSKKNYTVVILMFITLLGVLFILHLSMRGVLCSFIGGIAGFLYRKYSFQLSQEKKLNSTQILAVRFWLLWLILFCLAPLNKLHNFISLHYILLIILVAFISFILQNWLNQQGILKAGVKRSTTILALTPLMTVVCQYIFLHQYSLNWVILSIICLVIVFSKEIAAIFTIWIKKANSIKNY